jgi:hypothetical protein
LANGVAEGEPQAGAHVDNTAHAAMRRGPMPSARRGPRFAASWRRAVIARIHATSTAMITRAHGRANCRSPICNPSGACSAVHAGRSRDAHVRGCVTPYKERVMSRFFKVTNDGVERVVP